MSDEKEIAMNRERQDATEAERRKIVELIEAGKVRYGENAQKYFDAGKVIDNHSPDFTITDVKLVPFKNGFMVEWGSVSAGFGQVHIYLKDGKLMGDTETMSKDFVKSVLNKLVDEMEVPEW